MDELVNLVQQRTGLPPDKAKVAVDTVVNYIKGRLPAPVAGQVDAALKGGANMGDVAKGLGGMMGR